MSDFALAEAWTYYRREQLARRYGLGTFVAVYDNAVIDWGPDEEAVRARAEKAAGEPVFVGPIPGDPYPDYWDDYNNDTLEYKRYQEVAQKCKYRRRFSFNHDTLKATDELDITGTKREMADGYVLIDDVERRYSDLDYRLLVEHGAIPEETELIGGVVFWKAPGSRDRELQEIRDAIAIGVAEAERGEGMTVAESKARTLAAIMRVAEERGV